MSADDGDCPNCPNQGWYYSSDRFGNYEQVQCEWCITNEKSKFNLEQQKVEATK